MAFSKMDGFEVSPLIPSCSISPWISPLSRALRLRKSSQTLCPKLSKPNKGFLFIFFTPIFQCDHLCQTPFKAFSFHMAGCQKDLNYFQGQRTSDHATAQAKQVHIIIFDALVGGIAFMDQGRADPRYFVGSKI